LSSSVTLLMFAAMLDLHYNDASAPPLSQPPMHRPAIPSIFTARQHSLLC